MKLTNRPRASLLKLGRRLRIDSLLQQARYTHDLAASDRRVARRVGAAFLAELKTATKRLSASVSGRTVSDARAKATLRRKDDAVLRAMAWRREFTQLAKVAILRGFAVPRALSKCGRSHSAGRIAAEIRTLAEAAAKFRVALDSCGVTPALLKQGLALAREVQTAETEQDLAHRARRKEAVRQVWMTAAEMYLAVRQVNAFGRSIHAGDRAAARNYTLALMRPGVVRTAPVEVSRP